MSVRRFTVLAAAALLALPLLAQAAAAQDGGLGTGLARPGADAGRAGGVGSTPGTSLSSPAAGALSSPSQSATTPPGGLSNGAATSLPPVGGTAPTSPVPAPTQGTIAR